jgi:DDE superfamily endonuclease
MDLCAPLKARKLRLRRRNQLGGGHDQAEASGIGAGGPVSSRKRKLAAVAASILIPLLKQERAACAPNRPRMGITFESLLKPFTDREFKDRYRLTKRQFDRLLAKITDKCPEYAGSREDACDPRLKLASCLRFLAGGRVRNVADLHGQRIPTFYKHLDETLDAIIEVEKDEEQLPLGNDAEQRERLEELSRRCRRGPYAHFLKGLFGFVDGLIVKTRMPEAGIPNRRDWHCTRKGCWGLNAQGICDDNLIFTFFALNCAGGTHDSTALDLSWVGRVLKAGLAQDDLFLFGDAAYGGKAHILTPYSGAKLGDKKDTFNYVLSYYRSTIERAFGLLVRRWGILWSPLTRSSLNNAKAVLCCVLLHNICQRDQSKLQPRRRESDMRWRDARSEAQPANDDGVREAFLEEYIAMEGHASDMNAASKRLRDVIANQLHAANIRRP